MKNLSIVFLALLGIALLQLSCTRSTINRQACSRPATQVNLFDTCTVSAPNIITPNGDGINDVFRVSIPCPDLVDSVRNELIIFGTDGFTLIHRGPITSTWDGLIDGEPFAGEVNIEFSFFETNTGDQNVLGGTLTVLPYDPEENNEYNLQNCSSCRFGDQTGPDGEFTRNTQEPLRLICD